MHQFKKENVFKVIFTMVFCVCAVGGFGGRVLTDSLPGRVHPGGAGHEDQPDGGQGAGRQQQRDVSWARLTMQERVN